MDIAALSMAMSQSSVKESAGIAVMKKSMDNSKEAGNSMVNMLQNNAVDSNLGQSLDVNA